MTLPTARADIVRLTEYAASTEPFHPEAAAELREIIDRYRSRIMNIPALLQKTKADHEAKIRKDLASTGHLVPDDVAEQLKDGGKIIDAKTYADLTEAFKAVGLDGTGAPLSVQE